MEFVFVFGTLKEGFPNFGINRGVRVQGTFATCEAYPLYLVGERHSPWMLDARGTGLHVRGQVFRVDADTLAAMDRLERIDAPDGYRRVRFEVEALGSSVRQDVFVYLKPAGQLDPAQVRLGPLAEYTQAHAALYRPRGNAR